MTNVVNLRDSFAAAEAAPTTWPEPVPLPQGLLSVPEFDPTLLPSELRPWVEDITERMCVPMDFTAIPAMIAAGSLIGSRIGIRPQAKTEWTEVANIWGVVVAPPGAMKSPAVSEIFKPIRRMEANAFKAYQNELACHQDDIAIHKMARGDAEKKAMKNIQGGNTAGARELLDSLSEPTPPKARRFVVTDATVEKLGEICADNPQGFLVHRDELPTLLTDLESEDKANARGFFLQAWSGMEPYSYDRITRGSFPIDRVNMSLFGTSQPLKMAEFLKRGQREQNDGMAQRLQLLSFPDLQPEYREVDRYANEDARDGAYACLNRLSNLTPTDVLADRDLYDGGGIPFLRLDEDARGMFSEWRRSWLEPLVRGDELPPALSAHFSKYRGLIPRLALIIHLASGGQGNVSAAAMESALLWAGYLDAHARRAYGALHLDSSDAARSLWSRIKAGRLGAEFTERDVNHKGWSNLTGNRLSEALKVLVDCDWLILEQRATGGRPTRVYRPNPRALEMPTRLAA